jgi:hypothetical protein
MMTSATLQEALEDPNSLLPPGDRVLPSYLEVARVIDLAARFKGAKTFVEESWSGLESFYRDVGQHLSKWVPKAPKIKAPESKPENIELSSSDSIDGNSVITHNGPGDIRKQ